METAKLKKFAQLARRSLLEQVSAKLKLVLAENSAARRESSEAIKKLEEAIKDHGKEQVIERVAYIWFNRFCALRFMDVNRYNRVNVVSPADPGQFQPEILAEAKMGHIDEEMVNDKVRQQIFALLDGKAPSRDPQGEAYHLLVVAACNFWNKAMPFLFQRIDDYTELLMPDDLLSGNSILAYTREAMTPKLCGAELVTRGQGLGASKDNTSHQSLATSHSNAGGVEVIGWLYQFYISEKKDEVFDGLKKNRKITPENIPAATQLFTPHWIVRYLVENSLGRLWLLNRPGSRLVERMDYYIKPAPAADGKEQAETDFLRISKPEEIKICDPACGSGHMLTYAFDLLYAIYEEEGYEPAEIPEKILTNNLYGIEIDERAGELAAFAMTMKARAKQRRFFSKGIKPNICVLENVRFDEGELKEYMDFIGRDLFTAPLQTTLRQFEEADNFGSLIRPDVTDVDGMLRILESKNVSGQLFISMTHHKVLQALRQADYLSPKYHVVIANPPYMGGKGMNGRLGAWAKDNYPTSKADLFAMFIERGLKLVPRYGYSAMVTMQSWMFLSTYESLRIRLMSQTAIESMAHMANMVMGIAFGTAATVWKIGGSSSTKGSYCYIEYENLGAGNKPTLFPPHNERNQKASAQGWFYRASAVDFKKIPGSPVAYWVSDAVRSLFDHPKLGELSDTRLGMATANNDLFMRQWTEVSFSRSMLNASSRIEAESSKQKWFPYQKGGEFRKWYGNLDYLVNWQSDGEAIRNFVNPETGKVRSHNYNLDYIFREGVTWNALTSYKTSARISRNSLFDNAGSSLFAKDTTLHNVILAYLNSNLIVELISLISPTLNYQPGDIGKLPAVFDVDGKGDITKNAKSLIELSSDDWDSFETSWDFTSLPLLNPDYRQPTLKATCQRLRTHWREMTLEMQRLEEENNRIFIEAYGLQEELTPEVPLNEITLTCNPHYRYGNDKSEDELEALLLADTMRELVSYAVGCMFGRYALDKPGLILANQGETLADFVRKVTSDQWPVASNSGENNEREKLQGSDSLAKGDGFSGAGLSSHESISEGRTVRLDQSGSSGGGVDSVQHSGGASASIVSGVQKLSVDSKGIFGGSGNATADSNSSQLSDTRTASPNHGSPSGSQQNDSGADGKTGHWPLTTSHLSFVPDEDNVIPMLDGDWFTDDIAERFRKFLRVAFGEEHYEANLRFVEQALNIKGKRNYGIRDYFLGEFYTDHVKRYKKRPIYWLFSSPKGSFNALIYMHRYRPDTVSVVLNDYLREFRTKLAARLENLRTLEVRADASKSEKTKALKEIESIRKILAELDDYERDTLYPLAAQQLEIDLDDGVKVNYPKFGAALKKIAGLEAKED